MHHCFVPLHTKGEETWKLVRMRKSRVQGRHYTMLSDDETGLLSATRKLLLNRIC